MITLDRVKNDNINRQFLFTLFNATVEKYFQNQSPEIINAYTNLFRQHSFDKTF